MRSTLCLGDKLSSFPPSLTYDNEWFLDIIYSPHLSVISCSSSSENLSTVSPAGVNELDLGLWNAESNFYLDGSNYQDAVVDDPLEWFNLDAPDVPIFPDFQETLDMSLHPKTDAVVESLSHCMDPKVTVQSLFLDEQPLHM